MYAYLLEEVKKQNNQFATFLFQRNVIPLRGVLYSYVIVFTL